MLDILLTLCLIGDPASCREERHGGGADLTLCRATADALAAAARAGGRETPQSWTCVAAGADDPFPLTEIAPGVFVHKGVHEETNPGNRGDIANLGLIVGRDAAVAIDAGGSAHTAEAFLAAIRRVTEKPVRWLVLTHMHPDHTLGAGVFAHAGAAVLGHPNLPRAFAARRAHYLAANERLMGAAFEGTEADFAIEPAPATLDLGKRKVRLKPVGVAHTDNDLIATDEKTGVRFLGDLLFVDHIPVIDGSVRGWLERMDRIEGPGAFVPGHGPAMVDYAAAAPAQRRYLEGLVEEAERALESGATLLETIRAADPGAQEGWLLADAFHKRNLTAVFSELEWE